jgi:probable rRNA maturation factor
MMPAPSTDRIVVEVGDARSFLKDGERSRLADVARRVLEAEGVVRAEISIAIVDDPTIHEVNRRHLDHDWPTDVISFILSGPDEEPLSGELIVSAETAARMAERDGVWTELVLYVIHGLLHLCGHDDLTEEGAAGMRRREGELLAAEGLRHPFSPARPDREGKAPDEPEGTSAVISGWRGLASQPRSEANHAGVGEPTPATRIVPSSADPGSAGASPSRNRFESSPEAAPWRS